MPISDSMLNKFHPLYDEASYLRQQLHQEQNRREKFEQEKITLRAVLLDIVERDADSMTTRMAENALDGDDWR